MKIILGSQSPRRAEILGFFNIPFTQVSPVFDEEAVPFHGDPASYVCAISRGKALSLADRFPSEILLTADTAVYRDGQIYNKPSGDAEALQMLSELSGHWHSVHSALTLRRGKVEVTLSEESRVLFHHATEKQLKAYLKSVHSADKAGGYAIQGAGSVIVQRIEGCYYNVMGLPVNTLAKLLQHIEIDLWEHLG